MKTGLNWQVVFKNKLLPQEIPQWSAGKAPYTFSCFLYQSSSDRILSKADFVALNAAIFLRIKHHFVLQSLQEVWDNGREVLSS